MKSLKEYVNICEDRIGDKTLYPGDIIVCKNPIMPDKPNWEINYVDKDKTTVRGTNKYGQTVTIPIENIIEIKRVAEAPKRKVSFKQQMKLRREIRELENQLDDLYCDMENDPEVLDERGEGGRATDRYGKEMNKIMDRIENLKQKLENA